MASGTVYPAKVALKALLEDWDWPASTTGASPRIAWGAPSETEDQRFEAIYFGSVELADDFRILGATRSDETYNLPVVVDVHQRGDSEQATEQRAWVLHDEILTLLRANMTLSGVINRITGYRVRHAGLPSGPKQWRSQILIEVFCVGYITY
jgi:hypothetical protein